MVLKLHTLNHFSTLEILERRRREVFVDESNGANFWEEMSTAGVGKNEEKNDNLSSSDVIVFPHILSNNTAGTLNPAQPSLRYLLSYMSQSGLVSLVCVVNQGLCTY